MLSLDDELLREYFAFEQNRVKDYNKETIIKLFKYLQPFKMSVRQKEDLKISDEKVKSLRDSGIVKIYRFEEEEDLIQSTKLKIMLTKDSIDGTFPYPYVNILEDEIDVNFTATYKSGENRDKAIAHIKALLLDANEISIYDKYFSYKKNWKINRELVNNICLKITKIKIYADKQEKINKININIDKELFFKRIGFSNLSTYKTEKNTHDRYIETDKVIILLTSGLYYLSDTTVDFTYIVKIK